MTARKRWGLFPWPQPRPGRCLLWDSECVVAGGFRWAKWSAKNFRALGVKMSPFSGKCFFKNENYRKLRKLYDPSLCFLEKTIENSWDSSVRWSTRFFFSTFQITICCAASPSGSSGSSGVRAPPRSNSWVWRSRRLLMLRLADRLLGTSWYPENVGDHRGLTHWILKRY